MNISRTAIRLLATGVFAGGAFIIGSEAMAQVAISGGSPRGSTSAGMFGTTTLGAGTTSNMQSSSRSATGATSGSSFGTAPSMQMAGQSGTMAQPGGYVGASSANVTNFMSQLAGGATAQRGNSFSSLANLIQQTQQNAFNTQAAQRNSRGGQGRTQVQLVVPLRVGFQAVPVSTASFNAGFSERLAKMPALGGSGSIAVALEGRTAVLRGTVASEPDRQLAEMLALLEPEVLQVRNELQVAPVGTQPELLGPAAPALP